MREHGTIENYSETRCRFRPVYSNVDPFSQYLQTAQFTVTATAIYGSGSVTDVTLWYRYSNNNASWGPWTPYLQDIAMPWSWDFPFPNFESKEEH
jgi:hypothetical protein